MVAVLIFEKINRSCGAGVNNWKNMSRLIALLKVLSIDVTYLFNDCSCSTFDITMCLKIDSKEYFQIPIGKYKN